MVDSPIVGCSVHFADVLHSVLNPLAGHSGIGRKSEQCNYDDYQCNYGGLLFHMNNYKVAKVI